MILLGIDPDMKGGLAVVNTATRDVISLSRMPILEAKPPLRDRDELDTVGTMKVIEKARAAGAEFVILEEAIVKPQFSKKGPAMMGSVGIIHQNYGAIRAMCHLAFTPSRVILAHPASWKRKLGLTSDKELSLSMAVQLYPGHTPLFSLMKNAGLAEAVLLTEWGKLRIEPKFT